MKRFIRVYGSGSGSIRHPGDKYTDHSNCNFILFTKLPWPGDSDGTFQSSSHAATSPPVYHTQWRIYTVPLFAERQAGKLYQFL